MDKKLRILFAVVFFLIALVVFFVGEGGITRLLSILTGIGGVLQFVDIFFPEIRDHFRNQSDEEQSQEIFQDLMEEKLESKEEEISKKDERIEYILDSLDRDVLTADYFVDKYDNQDLYSVLAIFSHQRPDKFIKEKIQEMGGKIMLNGKAGVIPPQEVPDGKLDRGSLEDWFDEEFLSGDENKQYKVRLIPLNLSRAYLHENINREDFSNPDYGALNSVFDVEDIISAKDVYDLIKDEISFKDEIKENIGLLLIPIADSDQLDTLLESDVRLDLQDRLGGIEQILNTDEEKIQEVLSEYVDNSDELASDLKREANEFSEKYDL